MSQPSVLLWNSSLLCRLMCNTALACRRSHASRSSWSVDDTVAGLLDRRTTRAGNCVPQLT